MYNDPSQMREALAWRLFRNAGVPSARHTYAKLAFDATYSGLFSVIEQVDRRFLKDHFGDNDHGNLYKAYCGDVGCATLEHRAALTGTTAGGSTQGRRGPHVPAQDQRGRPDASHLRRPGEVHQDHQRQGLPGGKRASRPTHSVNRSTA